MWGKLIETLFYIIGSLLAAYFNSIENSVVFATVYNALATCLCGVYLSFM